METVNSFLQQFFFSSGGVFVICPLQHTCRFFWISVCMLWREIKSHPQIFHILHILSQRDQRTSVWCLFVCQKLVNGQTVGSHDVGNYFTSALFVRGSQEAEKCLHDAIAYKVNAKGKMCMYSCRVNKVKMQNLLHSLQWKYLNSSENIHMMRCREIRQSAWIGILALYKS